MRRARERRPCAADAWLFGGALLAAHCNRVEKPDQPPAVAPPSDVAVVDMSDATSPPVSPEDGGRVAIGTDATTPVSSAGSDGSATSVNAATTGTDASATTADGATSSTSADGATSSTSTGPFPPVSDFGADGPFTATTVSNAGPNNNYTVYLPKEIAPSGAKNPIVAWMNGGSTGPDLYPLLPRLATHGFLVVASNTIPNIGQEVELGQEMIAGIDWAIAENARQESNLFDRLDTTKIGAMGYSMGSLATFTIANDPRLTTTVHISGGNMQSDRIQNLRAPAAFFCGIPGDSSCNILSTDCDIAAANCDTDFANATTPVFYGNFPGGHLGILTQPNQDRIDAAVTAWLRWMLMADATLKTMFVGSQCTLCKDPNWKIQEKNLQ